MSDIIDRLYASSKYSASQGEVWDAVTSLVYADVLVLSDALSSAPNDERCTISGETIGKLPAPLDSTAASLVEAMRYVLVSAIPQEYREEVWSLFAPTRHLEGLDAPSSHRSLRVLLRELTDGLKPHAFKERKVSDSRVHARAAHKMAQTGVDLVDIRSAVRASDLSAFEAHSIKYSLEHADWALDAHAVRWEMAREAATVIAEDAPRDVLRKVLSDQFEGLTGASEIQWVIQ